MDERIDPGTPFDADIEEQIEECDALLAVMTHDSRRDTSVCRDEVVYALNWEKRVIPIRTAEDVRPTLLLCRRNWVDLADDYDAGLNKLLGYLSDEEGMLSDPLGVAAAINEIDFSRDLARLREGFVGRDWLTEKIDQWLAESPRSAMVIIGEPGIGKSAIAAWLVHERDPQIAAVHLCSTQITDSTDPHRFVETVVAQLSARLPEYASLVEMLRPEQRRETAGRAFEELVTNPLSGLECERDALLLVVDSLDEAQRQDGETVLDVLEANVDRLPGWLRVIVTTRADDRICQRIRAHEWIELEAEGNENMEDVSDFIAGRLEDDRLAERLVEADAAPAEVQAEVERISAGNFLVAKALLIAVEEATISVDDLSEVAPDLHDFYQKLFRAWFPDTDEFDADYYPLFGALAISVGPLPRDLIEEMLGRDARETRRRLIRIGQVLQERDGGWVLFHSTLRDWLSDADLAVDFWCDPKEAHEHLGEVLMARYGRGELGEYGSRALPVHLREAQMWEPLTAVLTDYGFVEGLREEGMPREVATEYSASYLHLLGRTSVPPAASISRALAVNLSRIADEQEMRGDATNALISYNAAHQLMLGLADDAMGDVDGLRDLSVSHDKMGDILLGREDRDGAMDHYKESLAIREDLMVAHPLKLMPSDLVASYQRVAQACLAHGDTSEAVPLLQKALVLCDQMVAQHPDDPSLGRAQSLCHERLGDAYARLGDHTKAMAAYQETLAIVESLIVLQPNSTELHFRIAMVKGRIADSLRAQGHHSDALDALEAGREALKKLTLVDPLRAEWRSNLAVCEVRRGDILVQQADYAAALVAYEASLNALQPLLDGDARNRRFLRQACDARGRAGTVAFRIGRLAEAKHHVGECCALIHYMRHLGMALDPLQTQILDYIEKETPP